MTTRAKKNTPVFELENRVAYLERKLSRLQENQRHQEKLEDLNRLLLKNALQELERSREKAEIANRAKTDFLANMSHEIRTPLNIILGMSELLENTELTERQKQFIDRGRDAGRHLLELINNILEFSRIEKGSVRLTMQPFDLKNMADNLAATFTTLCADRNLEFWLDYDLEQNILFWGDEPKIRQILLNLLTNAVKFTDRGRIRLRFCQDHLVLGNIKVVVEDTGIGISKDHLGKIFERFNQEESPLTKSRQGGVGLGLAIVKLLVQKMGGTIEVSSTIRQGSQFIISLPLERAQNSDTPDAYIAGSNARTEDLDGIGILVVDDVPGNLYVVEHYLEGVPLNAVYCSSGQQAVDLYRSSSFDVVLMDICMPEIDGIEALKQLRSLESQSGRPPVWVIAMTAHAFHEIHADLQAQGFNQLLTKPFSRDELLDVLKNRNHRTLDTFSQIPKANEAAKLPATPDVAVPTSLLPLVPILLEKLNREHDDILKAVENSDYLKLIRLCHANKGVVGMYGFRKLSQLYERIEQAARHETLDRRDTSLEELNSYLAKLSDEYSTIEA